MMNKVKAAETSQSASFALKAVSLTCLLIFLVWTGRSLSRGSSLPILIAIALFALIIIFPEPIRGLYLAYPIMFLIPYGTLWFDFPLFNSPLDVVVILTFTFGALRFARHKKSLPKSGGIYILLLICIAILSAYALVGHGEVAGFRLFRFVQGLWPFVLVVLLVESPRQARNVLISLLVTFVLLSVMWLPGLITAGKVGGNLIRSAHEAQRLDEGVAKISLSYASTNLSYLTLLAIAFVAIMSLGWTLTVKMNRLLLSAGSLLLCAVVLWASYASAVVALIAGVVLILLIMMLSRTIGITSAIPWLLLIVAAIAIFILVLPQGRTTFERIVNPSEDPSGSSRMWAFTQGVKAFRANPLTGYGAYNRPTTVSRGLVLAGHNTFIVMAYEFGLLFMLPYVALFFMIARGFYKLISRTGKRGDKGLAVGMAASIGAAVVTGFITLVFLEPAQDAILWLFVGLMTVWNNWLDNNPEARLVD